MPSRPRRTARTETTESCISASRSPANHDRRLRAAANRCAGGSVPRPSPSQAATRLPASRPAVAWSSPVFSGLPRSGTSFSWSLRLRRSSAQHPGSAQPLQRHRRRRSNRLHSIGHPQVHLTDRRLLNTQRRRAVCLRVRPANSPDLRDHPRAVHRSSASHVSLNPPRSHSVAPNPACSGLRFARR